MKTEYIKNFKVKSIRPHRVINDSLFEHLFGRYHWLKQADKIHSGDKNAFNYCVKQLQLHKVLGRVYILVDFKNDSVENTIK